VCWTRSCTLYRNRTPTPFVSLYANRMPMAVGAARCVGRRHGQRYSIAATEMLRTLLLQLLATLSITASQHQLRLCIMLVYSPCPAVPCVKTIVHRRAILSTDFQRVWHACWRSFQRRIRTRSSAVAVIAGRTAYDVHSGVARIGCEEGGAWN